MGALFPQCRLLTLCLLLLPALGPAQRPLTPLPPEAPAPTDNPTTTVHVNLGERLFFDPRLSGDNSMSCASCHAPDKGFADGLPTGIGVGGGKLTRNTPTVLNVGFLSTFLWDGRASSVEEQALGPITSPDEMAQDLDELVEELARDPSYAKEFDVGFLSTFLWDGRASSV